MPATGSDAPVFRELSFERAEDQTNPDLLRCSVGRQGASLADRRTRANSQHGLGLVLCKPWPALLQGPQGHLAMQKHLLSEVSSLKGKDRWSAEEHQLNFVYADASSPAQAQTSIDTLADPLLPIFHVSNFVSEGLVRLCWKARNHRLVCLFVMEPTGPTGLLLSLLVHCEPCLGVAHSGLFDLQQ